MAQKRDYYEVLGVDKGAEEKEIKRAYRRLALKYHPDKNQEADASDRFKEVSEAYAVLSDPDKRRRYDQFGHAGIDERYSQEDIFRGVDFSEIFGEGGLGDIFSQIFGGGMGGFGGFGGFGGGQRDDRGRSILHPLEVSIKDAFEGRRLELDLRRLDTCDTCKGAGSVDGSVDTCNQCGGRGQVAQVQRTPFGVMQRIGTCPECRGQGEKISNPCRSCRGEGRTPKSVRLEVQVPKGVSDGTRLRLAGEGEAGLRGGAHGDLLLEVHVKKDPKYERRGDDLVAPLYVSMPRAALGGRVPFEHLDGELDVEVPQGIQSGEAITIEGRGMPRMGGRGQGDLHLVVQVVTPKNPGPRAKHLLEELAEELGEARQVPTRKKSFMDRVVDAFKQE